MGVKKTVSNKSVAMPKQITHSDPTLVEMILTALHDLENPTLEQVNSYLIRNYAIKNKTLLTHVLEWLIETEIIVRDEENGILAINYEKKKVPMVETASPPATRAQTRRVLRSRVIYLNKNETL